MSISFTKWVEAYDVALATIFEAGMPRFDATTESPSGWHFFKGWVAKIEAGTGASKHLWLVTVHFHNRPHA